MAKRRKKKLPKYQYTFNKARAKEAGKSIAKDTAIGAGLGLAVGGAEALITKSTVNALNKPITDSELKSTGVKQLSGRMTNKQYASMIGKRTGIGAKSGASVGGIKAANKILKSKGGKLKKTKKGTSLDVKVRKIKSSDLIEKGIMISGGITGGIIGSRIGSFVGRTAGAAIPGLGPAASILGGPIGGAVGGTIGSLIDVEEKPTKEKVSKAKKELSSRKPKTTETTTTTKSRKKKRKETRKKAKAVEKSKSKKKTKKQEQKGSGPVRVEPYTRNGVRVEGYTRSRG
jgi:hypothetical protein